MTGEFETFIQTDMMVMSACLFEINHRDICAAAGSQNRLLFADIGDSKVIRLLEHQYQIMSIVEYKQYIIAGDMGVGKEQNDLSWCEETSCMVFFLQFHRVGL